MSAKKYLDIGILSICLGVLFIYLSPTLFLKNSKHLVHDNLNSNVVWYKILAESPSLHSYDPIEKVEATLSGVPRKYFPSDLYIPVLLNKLLEAENAYRLNSFILHFTAFVGMLLLARRFINTKHILAAALIGLAYSLMPFWPPAGLSIAGQPLLIFTFIRVYRNESNLLDWLFICFYPFYSSLVFTNLFVIVIALSMITYLSIKDRTILWNLVIAFFLFCLVAILLDIRIISTVIEDELTIRSNLLKKHYGLNWKGIIGTSLKMFLHGQYHAFFRAFPFIPLIAMIGVFTSDKRYFKQLGVLALLGLALSIIPNIRENAAIIESIPFLKSFNPRTYTVLPIVWYVILCFSMNAILKKRNTTVFAFAFGGLIMILVSHFFNLFSFDYQNSKNFLEQPFYYTFMANDIHHKSFDEYYLTKDFKHLNTNEVKNTRVLIVGLAPEIAQYNGLQTVGGYYPIWPQSKCDKLQSLKGNSSESCTRKFVYSRKDLENKNFNYDSLSRLNCHFLISSENINSPHLKLIKTQDEIVHERLLLYKISS